MAVSKLWSVKTRLGTVIDYATNPDKTTKTKSKYSEADYQALKDVLAYAKDEEKTEREFFCEGINCNVTTARDQFVTVKEQYDKTDGIQAYHGYLSFKDQDITPELAQKVGMEFAGRVWGKRYQVVVTTHLNTKHLHCHFVINSVSFVDGRKLHDEEKAWFKFHHIADEICKKYDLHTLDNPKRYQGNRFYVKKTLAGMPTRSNNAKAAIDYAVQHSHSMTEFSYTLSKMGYECNISPERKYWTIKPKGAEKAIRMYRLGEDYTNQKILERVRANSYVLLEPFQKAVPKPRQYLLITREDRIKKVGGLYGLYLHYCYKLGYLPNYKKQNPVRLHHLLREDLLKLDELTAQTTLLGKHHIGDIGQLFSYQQSIESEIKTLTADRTHFQNEIRRVDITDERLSAAKSEIAQISEKLKTLRKEVKLCKGIAERSGEIKSNLEQALAEEGKLKGKEKNRYEQRR